MGDYVPNGRYWSKNVHAVWEWTLARMKADGVDVDVEITNIEAWCSWWIENDPGDAGSYGVYERRNANARQEWREVWADYCRLGGPH